MGVSKVIQQEGSGERPQKGDRVATAYTGYIKDSSKPDKKGAFFHSSDGNDFVVQLGKGQLIRGWDEGLLQMTVGEKATLDITSDYAYGSRGFAPHIPPDADLIFDVELRRIVREGDGK